MDLFLSNGLFSSSLSVFVLTSVIHDNMIHNKISGGDLLSALQSSLIDCISTISLLFGYVLLK